MSGRNAKYDKQTFPTQAEGLARQGLNDEEIAQGLGIGKSTYYKYQQQFTEFREAIARGKAPIDTEVENALLKRCLGYEYNERHVETDGDGNPVRQKVIRKIVIPDIEACKFWLSRRKPAFWGNKVDVTVENASSKIMATVSQASNILESMSFEEQQATLNKIIEE